MQCGLLPGGSLPQRMQHDRMLRDTEMLLGECLVPLVSFAIEVTYSLRAIFGQLKQLESHIYHRSPARRRSSA